MVWKDKAMWVAWFIHDKGNGEERITSQVLMPNSNPESFVAAAHVFIRRHTSDGAPLLREGIIVDPGQVEEVYVAVPDPIPGVLSYWGFVPASPLDRNGSKRTAFYVGAQTLAAALAGALEVTRGEGHFRYCGPVLSIAE